jgi:hypothetical protein
LGCNSQELSKEAPFILEPKKECIIFLQRKQASKAVNLRVRKRNRGGKKATPTRESNPCWVSHQATESNRQTAANILKKQPLEH